MEDKVDSHIVVMVGTNNLRSDGTQLIMRNYEDLVRNLKRKSYRRISVVEILKRNDLVSTTSASHVLKTKVNHRKSLNIQKVISHHRLVI